MTISSSNNKSGPYNGNGVTTIFARAFRVLDADHLKTYKTIGGVTTEVVSGITKDGIGSDAGSVTFLTAPASGEQITLVREIPLTQDTDYSAQGKVSPAQVEDDLDLQEMQLQDLSEKQGRSLMLPVSSILVGVTVPEPLPGVAIVGNSTSDGFESGPTASEISGAQGHAIAASASANAASVSAAEANAANAAVANVPVAIDAGVSLGTPADGDVSGWSVAGTLNKLSWADLKSTLKTYFDAIYQPVHARLTDIASISYAQGDVMYYNGSNLVKLAKGTATQVFSMNSGATAPEWSDSTSQNWTEIGKVEPTSDVASMTVTGLAGYKTVRARWVIGITGVGSMDMDIREAGGTWRNIVNPYPAAVTNNTHVGQCTFDNVDSSSTSNLVWAQWQNGTTTSGPLSRSVGQIRGVTSQGVYSAFSTHGGVIDELRFSVTTGAFRGAALDSRGYFIVEGQ